MANKIHVVKTHSAVNNMDEAKIKESIFIPHPELSTPKGP